MSEQRTKRYVEVVADFSPEGILTPQTVIWDTGQKFDITCISEVLPRKYSKTCLLYTSFEVWYNANKKELETEFVSGLVIYQAAFFAAVLLFGPFFRARCV